MLGKTEGLFVQLNDNFEKVLSNSLRLTDGQITSKCASKIKSFYFGDEKITESKIDEAVQFFGDILFVAQILGVVDLQQQKDTPTYFYKFSYRPNFPGIKDRFNVKIEG